MNGLTPKQYETLARPLNSSRVAKRSQGGQQLSYLEAFDVRAHLIRVFGYANFDIQMLDYHHVATREYLSKPREGEDPKPMVEVIYAARVQLLVRDEFGTPICIYSDGACGSASGPDYMLGEHHDNALKTASSDAMKRCAMNLGNQFGLSLYDHGSTRDIIKGTLIKPDMPEEDNEDLSDEAKAALQSSLGAELLGEEKTPGEREGHGNAASGEEPTSPPVAPPAEVKS